MMGDKVVAKRTARELGIPCVPGSDGPIGDVAAVIAAAEEIGYPVLIKAAAGGGGRGMKVATDRSVLEEAFRTARGEAEAAFGDGRVYMEKYLSHPRHIEIQVIGDSHGNVVHLGERDCSLQRKHQKLVEESPSPALNASQREEIGATVCAALRKLSYRNAGTVEFLYEDGEFYFIEMNTRLQVEHPVTEMITGIDLVREQIRIAAGGALSFSQDAVRFAGHAIECRVTAESPTDFRPSPGRVTEYHPPGGLGVRVDSALYAGYSVPPHYDSMVAKLIVHGSSRNEALMRLRRSLDEFVIGGIETTLPLHRRILGTGDFVDGNYDIHWLERFVGLKR
jgi:acetyl-CoA carboxylase biotin carboxylase subunit